MTEFGTLAEKEILNYAEQSSLILSKNAVALLALNTNWKKILEELAGEGDRKSVV